MSIPVQEIITKDNVSVRTASQYVFQVVDPFKAVTKIEDPIEAHTPDRSGRLCRSVLGQHELDELLSARRHN